LSKVNAYEQVNSNMGNNLVKATHAKLIVQRVSPIAPNLVGLDDADRYLNTKTIWDDKEESELNHLTQIRLETSVPAAQAYNLINVAAGGGAANLDLGVGAANGRFDAVELEMARTRALLRNTDGQSWTPSLTNRERGTLRGDNGALLTAALIEKARGIFEGARLSTSDSYSSRGLSLLERNGGDRNADAA